MGEGRQTTSCSEGEKWAFPDRCRAALRCRDTGERGRTDCFWVPSAAKIPSLLPTWLTWPTWPTGTFHQRRSFTRNDRSIDIVPTLPSSQNVRKKPANFLLYPGLQPACSREGIAIAFSHASPRSGPDAVLAAAPIASSASTPAAGAVGRMLMAVYSLLFIVVRGDYCQCPMHPSTPVESSVWLWICPSLPTNVHR